MQRSLQRFAFFFLASFTLASGVYYALAATWEWLLGVRHPMVFGALYRMFMYHASHPLPYIALACLCYAVAATAFAPRLAGQRTGIRVIGTLALDGLALLAASPLGGMLWHFHDMQAGYFPDWWMSKLIRGAGEGLAAGWAILLLSFPYNVIGFVCSVPLTRFGGVAFAPDAPPVKGRTVLRPWLVAAAITGVAGYAFTQREVVGYKWRHLAPGGDVRVGTVIEDSKANSPDESAGGVLVRWFPGHRLCTVTYDDRTTGESMHLMDGSVHWHRTPDTEHVVQGGMGLGTDYVTVRHPHTAHEERTTVSEGEVHVRRLERGRKPWAGVFVEYSHGRRQFTQFAEGVEVARHDADDELAFAAALQALRDPAGRAYVEELRALLEQRRLALRRALHATAEDAESCAGLR